jgi:HD superfamily phosphohydrolase
MAKMTLKDTMLCAHECLDAATLHRLAQFARKLGSIIINGQELTADKVDYLARESERTGEPICFPDVLECRPSGGSDERL